MKFQANDSRPIIVDKDGAREVGAYTQAEGQQSRAAGTPVVARKEWFDLALQYMRGNPALTNIPYTDDSVFADFLRFWDSQTLHAQCVVRAVFQSAPTFTALPAPEPGTLYWTKDADGYPILDAVTAAATTSPLSETAVGEAREWQCSGCGALLSSDMVDSLSGHRRVGDDGHGEPTEVHCGPCAPVPAAVEYATGGNDYCEACQQDRTIAAARADLARKVIKTLTELQIHDQYNDQRQWGFNYGKEKFLAALGELFTEEGIAPIENPVNLTEPTD